MGRDSDDDERPQPFRESDAELERAMGVFAARSREDGEEWTLADVLAPAELRLYRAVVRERWILDPNPDAGDRRVPVRLG